MDGRGFRVDDPARVGAVLDEAPATPGPVPVEAAVDPNEPLLPAVVSTSYAEHLRKTPAAGTPGAAEIEAALAREPARSMMRAGGR